MFNNIRTKFILLWSLKTLCMCVPHNVQSSMFNVQCFLIQDALEDGSHEGGVGDEVAQLCQLAGIVRALYPEAYVAVGAVFLVHVLHESLPLALGIELGLVGKAILYGAADDGIGVDVAVGLGHYLAIDAAGCP